MNQVYICFPYGRYKVVTTSYDDGKLQDRRLISLWNQYGIKGTFHLNSEYIKNSSTRRTPCVRECELSTLYKGHEIACHNAIHATMTRTSSIQNCESLLMDRVCLEAHCKYPVRGFSYPNGLYNNRVKTILKALDFAYARTTKSSYTFDIPDDFFDWHPTCHHNENVIDMCDMFLEHKNDQVLRLFHVWGHSYEFDQDDTWDMITTFAKKIGHHDDIWYATNMQLVQYLEAASRLQFLARERGVYNPSAESIWISVNQVTLEILGGCTILFDCL